MKRWIIFTTSLVFVILTPCSCRAEIADHFLFADDAAGRLKQVCPADTLAKIKLLANLSFKKDYDNYKEYRKQAQALIDSFRTDFSPPVVNAYYWALKVMEIRDWGVWDKLTNEPKNKVRQMLDSLTLVVAAAPDNEVIRFLRVNVVLESANHLPDILDSAATDLRFLDLYVGRSDPGAAFLTELLWAKYYYWKVKKTGKSGNEERDRWLENAQHRLNCAAGYAVIDFYQSELIIWKKRIDKEKPDKKIWSPRVLELSERK